MEDGPLEDEELARGLRAMRMIQKQGYWVPHELKPRDIERRFFACELLLERHNRNGFLHRIVTIDEKWVHYENPKHKKLYGPPGHTPTMVPKRNLTPNKVMLCIWWDQQGVVYYELLKSEKPSMGIVTDYN